MYVVIIRSHAGGDGSDADYGYRFHHIRFDTRAAAEKAARVVNSDTQANALAIIISDPSEG